MKSHTSLIAQQTRLNEWAELIRDCQSRPQGMKIDEWCQLHDITKASYYWRLRKVREAYLKTAEQTPTFVEVPSSAIHPVNIASEYKIAAVLRSRNNITLEITEQASASYFLCIWMAGTIVILQDSSIKMEFYRRLYRENSIKPVKSRFRSQNPGIIMK